MQRNIGNIGATFTRNSDAKNIFTCVIIWLVYFFPPLIVWTLIVPPRRAWYLNIEVKFRFNSSVNYKILVLDILRENDMIQ